MLHLLLGKQFRYRMDQRGGTGRFRNHNRALPGRVRKVTMDDTRDISRGELGAERIGFGVTQPKIQHRRR
jgi:hypothetical protein